MGNKKLYTSIPASQFGIGGDRVTTKRIEIDPNDQAPNTTVVLKGNSATATNITLTLPSETGTIALDSSPTIDSFKTIQCPSGTSPVADSPTDTLTLSSTGGSLTITGNSTTDTVNFDLTATGVGAGSYTNPTIVVNSAGRITLASSGAAIPFDWMSHKNNNGTELIHHVDQWWQGPHVIAASYRDNGITDSRIYFHPIIMPKDFTITDLGAYCSTPVGDGLCILALYRDRHGVPEEKVLRSDPIDCSTSGVKVYSEHKNLEAGKYWLGIQCKDGMVPTLFMRLARTGGVMGILGSDEEFSLSVTSHLFIDGFSFNDFPNPVVASDLDLGTGDFPAVFYRFDV